MAENYYVVNWQSDQSENIPGKDPIIVKNVGINTDTGEYISEQEAIDSTSTSISLTGRGVKNYGEIQQENFIRLLENFASSNPPAHPTIGQLWYQFDANNQRLKTWNGNSWHEIGATGPTGPTGPRGPAIHVGPTPPLQPKEGECWFEDSVTGRTFIWTGSVWVDMNPAGDGNLAAASVGTSSPSNPGQGALWYNSDEQITYIWVNDSWRILSGGNSSGASIVVSSTAPSSPSTGDVWFNILGEGRAYVWDSEWKELSPNTEGPKGPTGPTGVPGPTGPGSSIPGPTGPAGPGLNAGSANQILFKNVNNQLSGSPGLLYDGTHLDIAGTITGKYAGQSQAFIDQDDTTAVYFTQSTQVGSSYIPVTKIKCSGATKNRSISFGALHNTNNSIDAVIHSINSDNSQNHAWVFRESGDFYSPGNLIAYSDARLKNDVSTIDHALEKVNLLRGVYYTKQGEQRRSLGVIAQEVKNIVPEAVYESADEDPTLAVAYGNMVGLLIESIKELNKEVNQLKQEISELKTK